MFALMNEAKHCFSSAVKLSTTLSYGTHYFSKVFKQQTGMTPTEYRNSLKQDPT